MRILAIQQIQQHFYILYIQKLFENFGDTILSSILREIINFFAFLALKQPFQGPNKTPEVQ